MRLAKFLSSAGVASRRAAEQLIRNRRVTVNGGIVTDPAHNVVDLDRIEFDGRWVAAAADHALVYIMLHKPVGVVSTMAPDKEQGECLADLVQLDARVYPVGRLDRDSSGLLILTNDGNLTYELTHPGRKVKKEYIVKLNRTLSRQDFNRISRGVKVDDRIVEIDSFTPARGGRLSLVIHEGRKHIVRRLFEEVGYRVIDLKRVGIGPVRLGRLPVGKWRHLSDREIAALKG